MLNDADISHFHHVYVFVGKTDLRKGIDGLSTLVKQKFHLDPFHAGDLFLFCGFFRNYPFLCFPTYLSFASNKRFLQRPYIVRFIIFNRLFVPSTKPLL